MNKNIVALGFVSFFTDLASSVITTILPIYIVYILKEGVDKLGFIVAIATFVSYIFRGLFGYFSDKYKIVKPFVVTGYTISAIAKPLLYFASSLESIAILRGVERVGKAVRTAPKDSLISNFSSKSSSGKSFGFHKMMDVAGEMSGAIIVFLALFYLGKSIEVFKGLFAFTAIPGILAVLIVIFFVKDTPYRGKKTYKFNIKDDLKLFPLLLIYFGFLFFIFDTSFYIIKAKEAGFALSTIPLLIILLNFVQTIFSYLFGINIDKFGAINILQLSFIFGIISIFFLYLNQIVISFIFLALFLVSSINSLRSYISIKAKNQATIYGVLYGGVAISSSLGATVVGLIWHYLGDNIAIYFSLCGSISIFLIFLLKLSK